MKSRQLQQLGLCAILITGAVAAAGEARSAPPPVETFAGHATIQDIKLSPDGKHIAFTYEEDLNEVKIAIGTTDLKEIKLVMGYGENHHMGNHFWADNNRLVVWESRNTGFLDGRRQNSQLLSFDIDGRHREELFIPARSRIVILSRLRHDPENILIAKYHFSDEGQVKMHMLNVQNGEMDYIDGIPGVSAESEIVDVGVDTNDEIRIAIEFHRGRDEYNDDDDKVDFHYKTSEGKWRKFKIEQARQPARYEKLGFSLDNRYYYFMSNYDMAENDTLGVFRFDFQSTEISPVFRHPDVDIQSGIYGPDGEVLGVRYEPGYPEKFYFDEDNSYVKTMKSLSATFPGQHVGISSYTDDGKTSIVRVSSDRNPGMYYLFKNGKLKHLASTFPDHKPELMGTTEAFIMKARDGVKLYGFITLPPGVEDKNLPMVVNPHGGPHGTYDRWGYDARVQMLAANGYAVLQVNFRGSGGYGVDFQESGYRKWGREMQDDVTDATLWAVQQGIADKNRICISGGSYGGYATLQALVREPDLYKCGIGVAGVYSLPMMHKKGDIVRNRRAARSILGEFIGHDKQELEANSPAFNVEKIKAAVFIIHGSEDVRVPIEQAELLRKRLTEAGIPFEWLVKKEGHGYIHVENRIEQYTKMLNFFDRHIGGDRLSMQ